MKRLQSTRFGELVYRRQDIISLPQGLVGLPGLRRWLMLDQNEDSPLKWLHSLDRRDFCVPVTEPVFFIDDYQFEVSESVRRLLGENTEAEVVVLVITTVHAGGTRITGNLLAPLLINPETRQGVQLPLPGDSYSVCHEMDYLKFGLASASKAGQNAEPGGKAQAGELGGVGIRDGQKVSL